MDPTGSRWRVTAPFQTDGATIPSLFWPIIGHPLGGDYVAAAIVHDYFGRRRYHTHEVVHRNFYLGMRASNVSEELATVMYLAVIWFGPAWEPAVIPPYCDAANAAFDPRRCVYNEDGAPGVPIPGRRIDKENLEAFFEEVGRKGFGGRANQLRQLPEVRAVLESDR